MSLQSLAVKSEGLHKQAVHQHCPYVPRDRPAPLKPVSDSLQSLLLLWSPAASCENECPIVVQSFAVKTLRSIDVSEEQTFLFLSEAVLLPFLLAESLDGCRAHTRVDVSLVPRGFGCSKGGYSPLSIGLRDQFGKKLKGGMAT